MRSPQFVTRSLAVFLVCTFTATASANSLLNVGSDSVVSRGDFIRAAVKALNLDTSSADESVLTEYVRVPRGLRPYIAVAHERGALTMFGNDLLLGRGISRGDAVQVATKLGDFDPVSPSSNFRDVRRGSAAEGAIGVALKEGWLSPIRDDIFGTTRMLLGSDAMSFIAVLAGDEAPVIREQREIREKKEKEEQDVQTIRINLQDLQKQDDFETFPKGEILWTLWQLIQKNYLYQDKIDAEDAAYDAAEAIMKSLDDPYTLFMRPIKSRNFRTQIQGEITGIGAQVEYKDNILTIVTPLRGSPAEKAGLKPGDQIIQVDGEDIIDIGFAEAVEKVRGPKGSIAKLTIRRDGIVFEKEVRRDIIKVPEIEISWQGEFAVVKLLQFGSLTDTQLRPELVKVQQQNPKGLILDLRNNPGGLLHAANTVVSNFVKKGSTVANVSARRDQRTEVTTEDPTINDDVPVVVLINGGSASASEIVAGALQDLNRATVIGEKSFGKGTVQQVLQFNDQSAMKMTIAEWLTPNGRKIDGVGVQPDIVVPSDERDTQMSDALDLLRTKARQ